MNYNHIKVPKLVCESRDRASFIEKIYRQLEFDGSYTNNLESSSARHVLHGIPKGMNQESLRKGLNNLLQRPLNDEDFNLVGFQRLRLELSKVLALTKNKHWVDIAKTIEEHGAQLFYTISGEYRN
ncbi:hypothetical protein COU54_03230 [Candidatus Pacearchaeota archaeon CG10_big_fil_rev_8_21_14_0_10_31_24]|nr:MAG: hypothetical protein COU54_03230 [Candidatus Pacearchaeota archaeon CG10_big_fil_rev_8_21_14_0_10_31_24]